MSASSSPLPASSRTNLGANLVLLAGVGLVGYGVMFLVRNFTGFIELGLTPQLIGGTPEEIRNSSNPVVQQFTQGKSEGPIKVI